MLYTFRTSKLDARYFWWAFCQILSWQMLFLRKRTFVVHIQFYNEAAENDVLLSNQHSCLVKEKAAFVLKSFSFMSKVFKTFSDNVSRVALTIKSLNNVNKIWKEDR